MTSMRALVVLVVLATLAACSTAPSPGLPPRATQPPRTRCLTNPDETGGLRPLIFLFCVESP